MNDSLSQRLNLRVNDCLIQLNEELNEAELSNHGIKKAGYFNRLLIKPAQNEIVYWSKNCRLTYLQDFGNAISPILEIEAGVDLMYGTTCYLFYKENLLKKFGFQIIKNKKLATFKLNEFVDSMIESMREPDNSEEKLKVWERNNESLIAEFPVEYETGFIWLVSNVTS